VARWARITFTGFRVTSSRVAHYNPAQGSGLLGERGTGAGWSALVGGARLRRLLEMRRREFVVMTSARRWWLTKIGVGGLALWIPCTAVGGCAGKLKTAEPDAMDRISRLKNLYFLYVEKNKKGPPSEEALREFGKKLSETERADRRIGNDLEGIFTSPR